VEQARAEMIAGRDELQAWSEIEMWIDQEVGLPQVIDASARGHQWVDHEHLICNTLSHDDTDDTIACDSSTDVRRRTRIWSNYIRPYCKTVFHVISYIGRPSGVFRGGPFGDGPPL